MDLQVGVGIDVWKTEHHATVVTHDGRVLVDQPKTSGVLVVAVAQQMNIQVAYLPGLTIRRVADLHPGQAKTDARDAYIIAETARTMPHTLRGITVAGEQSAELSMLCGFNDDLAAHLTQVRHR